MAGPRLRGLLRDGSGDVTREHRGGVRDAEPHIEVRELVPLTVLVLVLIGLFCAVQGDR
jgi:hypothetical protein